MIVIIIILAVIAFGNSTKPIDTAGQVKFLQELAEVRSSVNGKRVANAKMGTDEKSINQGFIKVSVANPPDGFTSFDSDDITGYVVDLTTIEYSKLARGRGYMDLNAGDVVNFGTDDVYLYDAAGNLYYAKGFETDSGDGEVIYADNNTGRKEGPIVEILGVSLGRAEIKVTPRYGGTISSVIVGNKVASSNDGETFTVTLSDNGTYVVIATEEGGGTTRKTLNVTDGEGTTYAFPVITAFNINNGASYATSTLATLKIEATNAAFMSINIGSSAKPNVNDGSKWRKYESEISLNLSEGKNTVYAWCKNAVDDISEYKMAEIIVDSKAPSKDAPSYSLHNYDVTLTANQKDSSEITIAYGMKAPGDSDFTWQTSNVFPDLEAGKDYVFATKATDEVGNETISNTIIVSINAIPGNVTIAVSPNTWSMEKEVVIYYPNTYGVNQYHNLYRIDGGEWREVRMNTFTMEVIANTLIEAAVSEEYPGANAQLGNIAKENITTIDRLKPEISNVRTSAENEYEQNAYNIIFDVTDSESGIAAWDVTTSSEEPRKFENTKNGEKELVNVTKKVSENGTYYIWVKDVSGQVSSTSVEVTNIDPEAPVIKAFELEYLEGSIKINAKIQDEKLGLEAWAIVKGEDTVPSESDWNTITPTKEEFEVTRNITQNDTYTLWARDISGRTVSSSKYIRPNLTVTYNVTTNGGTSISTGVYTKTVGVNMPVDLTPIAEKDVGSFVGWSQNPNATEGEAQIIAGTKEDITLYAIFKNMVTVTLVYYDGTEKVVLPLEAANVYNSQEIAYITLPKITKTYTGWTSLGFTSDESNTAKVEYSGDHMTVATSGDVTLYMMYQKNIRGTFRYYTSKLENSAVENGNYVYTERVSDTSYRGYYSSIDVEQETVRTNAAHVSNTTVATFTVPEVPSEVKYRSIENIWTLRGWSESQISNADISHHNGDQIITNESFVMYASYETTIHAKKYVHGTNAPTEVSGTATLAYNAEVRPARIQLGTADNISYQEDTYVPRGWSTAKEASALVNVENEGTAIISKDTNYYASYERDTKLTIYVYEDEADETFAKTYISYQGELIPAKFTMPSAESATIEGSTWLARGYSREEEANATIDLEAGSEISSVKDVTYYVSYYQNYKITRRDMNATSEMNATAFASYKGDMVKAKVNLGSISGAIYNGLTWRGSYFSTSTEGVPTKDALMGVETEVTGNTTFYAIYERDVEITKHIYQNREEKEAGLAYLNANGTIENAVINLGSTSSVSQDGVNWEFTKWSTSANIEDDSATKILPNGNLETYQDNHVYAIYGNDVSVKVYYLSEEGEALEDTVGSAAILNYAGEVKSEETATIPALTSITKDGNTWVPLGYLWSKEGYTLEDYDGVFAVGKEGKSISIEAIEKYYAVYETDLTIQKVEYKNITSHFNQKVRMNAKAVKQSVRVELGSASDLNVEGKIWTATGWMKEGSHASASTPDFANNAVDTISENTTYLATYSRDYHIEIQEFAAEGGALSRLEKVRGYMDAEGSKDSSTYLLPDVTIAKISSHGVLWDFDGWMLSQDIESEKYGSAGEEKQIRDDMILYARYSRNTGVTEYIYNAVRGGTKTGKAYINAVGNIKKAEVRLSNITNVTIGTQVYTPRGWSTGKEPTAGENFVASGSIVKIYEDLTFYASYQAEIVIRFISYNGTNQVIKTKRTSGYMNYVGTTTNSSSVVVPEAATFGTWKADGYTESHIANVEPTAKVFGLYTSSVGQDLYAIYQREVTLTYDPNGGVMTPIIETYAQRVNCYDTSSALPIEAIVTSAEPIKNGTTFAKAWTLARDDDSEGAYVAGEILTIENDTTLYAKYGLSKYTITFIANGGTVSPNIKEDMIPGEAIGPLPTPQRDGLRFGGWYTATSGGTKVTDDTPMVAKNITYYAHWGSGPFEIDGVYYDTLQKAINAVPTDNTKTTIRLWSDTKVAVTVNAGQNIVFDVQNYTIGNSAKGNTVFTNNGTILLYNGNFTSDATTASLINNNSGGNLTITGGTFNATGDRQIVYNNGGNVEISGTAYLSTSASERAAVQHLSGTLKITGGTIVGINNWALCVSGDGVTIGTPDGVVSETSPVLQGATYGITTSKNFAFYDGVVKGIEGAIDDEEKATPKEENYGIEHGITYVEGVKYNSAYLNERFDGITVTFDANGGTADVLNIHLFPGEKITTLPKAKMTGYGFDGWYTERSGGTEVTENTEIDGNVIYYAHWGEPVAAVNDVVYASFDRAFNEIPKNKEETRFTLLKDISVGMITTDKNHNIILDVQEYTMSNKGDVNIIKNYGKLTIVGGTFSSTAKEKGVIDNEKTGTLIITGGKVYAKGTKARQAIYNNGGIVEFGGDAYLYSESVTGSNARATIQNTANGTMTINGGTIIATNQQALKIDSGTVTIGDETDGILKKVPVLQGYTYAITTSVDFNFYDGLLKSGKNGTYAIDNNDRAITATGYKKVTDKETIEGQQYTTEFLEAE